MRLYKLLASSLVFLAAASLLSAAPVTVTYTVTGGSGNYTLDFSFTNNETGTDQAIYLLGVYLNPSLGLSSVTGSPSPYDPTVFSTWTNAGNGSGSNINYDDVWFDGSASNLTPGETLSGFDVRVDSVAPPSAVPWFALSTGNLPYTGTGSFTNDPYNPGFEGVATPEPSTFSMLWVALGSISLFYARARRCSRC